MWAAYPLASDKGFQNIIDLSAEATLKTHKPSEFYDNSYLIELQDFVKGLYPEGVPAG